MGKELRLHTLVLICLLDTHVPKLILQPQVMYLKKPRKMPFKWLTRK